MSDKDSIECDCGNTLHDWEGAVMYISKPSEKFIRLFNLTL